MNPHGVSIDFQRNCESLHVPEVRRKEAAIVMKLRTRVGHRLRHTRVHVLTDTGDEVGWFVPETGKYRLHDATLRRSFWRCALARSDMLYAFGQISEPTLPDDPIA